MKRLSGLVVGLAALAFAGAASASTVSITIDTSLPPDKIFTVEWEGSGAGFYDKFYPFEGDWKEFPDANSWADAQKWGTSSSEGGLSLSEDQATGWAGISPGDGGLLEAQFLDRMLVELDLPTASDIFWDKIDIEGDTFTTNREYFWIKTGQWIAYFQNTTGGAVKVLVDGGYSHYGVAGVPIPAAFVLFGSGLLGLGWLARRQRARKDKMG